MSMPLKHAIFLYIYICMYVYYMYIYNMHILKYAKMSLAEGEPYCSFSLVTRKSVQKTSEKYLQILKTRGTV